MAQFFDYSKYYNLLYQDKNYSEEVTYIDSLIKEFRPDSKTLLDVGCGTGKHATLMAKKGYKVFGVDLSEQMLELGKAELIANNVSFCRGDIRDLDLGQKFDVITSLFHVMSYQTSNDSVQGAFRSIYDHLNDDGIFIFDCWYGPAVLSDPPATRVKRMQNDELQITRLTESFLDVNQSTVEVNFQIYAVDKKTNSLHITEEQHLMRYFFENEMHLFATSAGLRIMDIHGWIERSKPTSASWYVTIICRKIK